MFGHHTFNLCHRLFRMAKDAFVPLWGSARLLMRPSDTNKPQRQKHKTRFGRVRAPLLIHYHIFKNAGTSFRWSLANALGEEAVYSLDSDSPRGFITRPKIVQLALRRPAVSVIASHQATPPAPRIWGREVFSSILIRDPLARLRSMYAFERHQAANSPGALKAKELNFKQYIDWRLEETPVVLHNYQVFFCTRSPKKEFSPPGRKELEKAIANLDTMSIVGTVARYDEWLALAQKVLSPSFPGLVLVSSRRNATLKGRLSEADLLGQLNNELGESMVQFLLENNQLDMRLHQIADALLTRRLAEHGVDVALERTYAAARHRLQPGDERSTPRVT